jgi:cyanophycinase-like exopeptidase
VTRILTIMGSGETAPTMIKPHRALFERLGPEPVPAVLLDTPYGFQANADDISRRAVDYFQASVGRRVEVAGLRERDGDSVARASALARVASARWVFAGPGSPTYALRQWRGTEVPDLLADKLAHGGCVVFASAAALTLGRRTVPVYEIYKVGAVPEWQDGLDLLGFLGPDVAVIPHYDNAEGGNHDTRFCYLGEPRLALLEEQMGPDGWVLGVDEHTGCVFDLEAGTATVVGNGVVTVRRAGKSSVIEAGTTLAIGDLVELAFSSSAASSSASAPSGAGSAPAASAAGSAPTALHADIRRLEEEFDAAVAAADVDAAVRAMLELDDTLEAWSGDTTQSDAGPRGRAALRRMIARLGDLARTGARDPREVVGGFVTALLAERAAARGDKRYGDADRIRDALVACGVEVRDTPEGTVWEVAAPAGTLSPPAPIV